ncbi:hypothetical protein [Parasitella parasitica]|uniref:Rab-GAP TBC domain-containing protein n=1 Tax=Parasitella parasitica TaxID=35722 RepID=A0A0B7N1V2_9FUNG|nr:hypothetical protein [Parasitella parasitica]
MHELLAPFYWILATESLDASQVDQSHSDSATKSMLQVLDSAFVEHDAYILFDKLMTFGKSWYEFNDDAPNRKAAKSNTKPDILPNHIPKSIDSALLNPVVTTCHRIHHQYLRTVDPLLYRHLENFGIEPQLYGISNAKDRGICMPGHSVADEGSMLKDYAECLTLLMRPPQVSKPASLVEQAKDLQKDLSEDTALHILQQIDIRSGKDPRNSMLDGVPEAVSGATAYSGQQQQRQHAQQRTLNHRSSQGFESFSRITTNMMKNPQVRDLNRAIAGVMKNVNTFGENVLGKQQEGPRRSTMSSEFPAGIDRIANTHKFEQRVPPIPLPKNNDDFARLASINRSMGDMMAKCISLLENEIFPEPSIPEKKDEAVRRSSEDSHNVSKDKAAGEDEDVADYDSNSSSIVEEREKASEAPVKGPTQNEATIIMALAGLKHVRDVLLGKQAQFDASVIDVKLDGSTPDSTANGEEWKWDLVDHKEAASINSTPSSPPPPTVSAKRTSATIFVPPQTSSSLISADIDSPTFERESKPLPPPAAPAAGGGGDGGFQELKLPQVPITYIPVNPTPPKQQIKSRIEDLLSDPDLQLSSPKASANAKFQWMLNNEDSPADKQTSSASSLNSSGGLDLFKSEQKPLSLRKRSSFIMKKPVSGSSNENVIDPLDARNVDSRRSYEYDML